jgi:tartrate dehydratase alpha subunit/fumarate hydratase class I-like protein
MYRTSVLHQRQDTGLNNFRTVQYSKLAQAFNKRQHTMQMDHMVPAPDLYRTRVLPQCQDTGLKQF